MGDEVVIGQDEMKEVIDALMADDIDIADVGAKKSVRSVHVGDTDPICSAV
jgi:ABC-type phosphate/phosphonate transport system substrate-binding protein